MRVPHPSRLVVPLALQMAIFFDLKLRKKDIFSVRNFFVVFCVAGVMAAAACPDPLSRENKAALRRPRSNVLLPNIDDDNRDGIPDVNGMP